VAFSGAARYGSLAPHAGTTEPDSARHADIDWSHWERNGFPREKIRVVRLVYLPGDVSGVEL